MEGSENSDDHLVLDCCQIPAVKKRKAFFYIKCELHVIFKCKMAEAIPK